MSKIKLKNIANMSNKMNIIRISMIRKQTINDHDKYHDEQKTQDKCTNQENKYHEKYDDNTT